MFIVVLICYSSSCLSDRIIDYLKMEGTHADHLALQTFPIFIALL